MKQPLLNAWVNNLNWEEALREIDGLIAGKEPSYLTESGLPWLPSLP